MVFFYILSFVLVNISHRILATVFISEIKFLSPTMFMFGNKLRSNLS